MDVTIPEGSIILFRNMYHFGRSHEGCRWLLFWYLDKVKSDFNRKGNETFRWGDQKHVCYVLSRNDIPMQDKDEFLKHI